MTRFALPRTVRVRGASVRVPPLDHFLFYVLLAVLCVRPLICETFERVELSFLEAIAGGSGPTPATTAWLDSVLLIASAAALSRRGGQQLEKPPPVAFVLGTLGMGLAVLLSLFGADDKRLAANAGFSLLIAVLAGAALVRLMRARWMARVLMAAMLATGGTTALKCITQRAYEFDDSARYWQEQKAQLRQRGFDLTDPTVINYERRLQSAEAFGYLSHPNLAASCLMMWLLVAAGLLGGVLAGRSLTGHRAVKGRPRGAALGDTRATATQAGQTRKLTERPAGTVIGLILCVPLGIGILHTGSAGAVVASAVGLAALVGLATLRHRIALRAGRAAAILAAGYLTVIVAGVGYGIAKGTLPHASLAFRWQYWTAAGRALQDAPLTGIGRENFLAAFEKYKSAQSPEEVRNPHQLWLSLLVELGPLGLIAGAMLSAACVVGMLRRLNRRQAEIDPQDGVRPARLATAAVGVLATHALLSGTELHDPNVLLLWAVEVGGTWILTLLLATWLIEYERNNATKLAWLVAGLSAAVMAALVHNLIDFSLLVPAGLSVFVALVACAFGLRSPEEATTTGLETGPTRPALAASAADHTGLLRRLAPPAVAAMFVAAYLMIVTIPSTRAEIGLARMNAAVNAAQTVQDASAALQRGKRAVLADPWDGGTARALARAALQLTGRPAATDEERLDWLTTARRYGVIARQRNPHNTSNYCLLAAVNEALEDTYLRLARPDDAIAALREAAANWQAAVGLYPTNPRTRISAGLAWFRLWKETESPDAALSAIRHFSKALAIDSQRPAGEVVRLRDDELATIYEHLAELREAAVTPAGLPSSAPQSSP